MAQEVIVLIRDVTILGEGVGTHEGLTIFVDGALPGETVRARITLKKPSYAKGELLEILDQSFGRVKPICPVFGKCGGCQIMHLAYAEQLNLKRKRVIDAFERIGKLKGFTVAPVEPWTAPATNVANTSANPNVSIGAPTAVAPIVDNVPIIAGATSKEWFLIVALLIL